MGGAEEPRSPYEVYLKVWYHLSRDVRAALIQYSVPPIMREQLLAYQVNAVQTLARRVLTRGGTMLGEVVVLGKTITAVGGPHAPGGARPLDAGRRARPA